METRVGPAGPLRDLPVLLDLSTINQNILKGDRFSWKRSAYLFLDNLQRKNRLKKKKKLHLTQIVALTTKCVWFMANISDKNLQPGNIMLSNVWA